MVIDLGIFEEGIFFDKLLELFIGAEEIALPLYFPFSGLSCRHRDGILEIRKFLADGIADGPLPRTARAGDDQKNAFIFFRCLCHQFSSIPSEVITSLFISL